MQVKKADLKETIIAVAKEEFIHKGYENASMRKIATKANTTLGNIYTYFSSKEELLSTILDPVIEQLDIFINKHLEEMVDVQSLEAIEEALKDFEDTFDESDFQYIMHRELLILFDLKTTKYIKIRENFLDKCIAHFSWHLHLTNKDSYYIEIMVNTFIECIRHLLLNHTDSLQAKEEFIKVFKMLCTGFVVNQEE